MFGIRQKLMLGFGVLVATVAVVGAITMTQIERLGDAIDVIMRENYRSVVACQDMKEALERMDSGVLFSFADSTPEGQRHIDENTVRFRDALEIELGNITLEDEQAKANRIDELFTQFVNTIPGVTNLAQPLEKRREVYFSALLPLFQEIKGLAQEILEMNQANMNDANDAARRIAASAHRRMVVAIAVCAAIAILFSFIAQRSILRPINKLIDSTNEIRQGNLDLVLDNRSRDEIGQLSESFNEMTAALRQSRVRDYANLMRSRHATEEVMRALPMAAAVLDLNGVVEVSTETAALHFGLKPGVSVRDLHLDWLQTLTTRALHENRMVERDEHAGYIQVFVQGKEYFFHPVAVPIPLGRDVREPAGIAVILKDLTQVHEQQELKRSVVSTVSHQLKTPLQSLRMSIHLLLEERIGPLNEKQAELVTAARDESERLAETLDDLLDLNRIASGGSPLDLGPVSPRTLSSECAESFLTEAKEKGVSIKNAVPENLPRVLADSDRIRHVFENLLSNAVRFTPPGGAITLSAADEGDRIRFRVTDTGPGIPPGHQDRVFEQFYRVPGQSQQSGVGLGLAIAKEIVEAHGGRMGVESTVGEGSTFWFTLPPSPD
jgi:signal transduction histidine kinase